MGEYYDGLPPAGLGSQSTMVLLAVGILDCMYILGKSGQRAESVLRANKLQAERVLESAVRRGIPSGLLRRQERAL